MTIVRILLALLVLNLLVMIHELGHFLAAKLVGVKVNEFAIGMGPKLLSWGKGETKYSIRALPIGGFCAMEGEDDGAPVPSALGGNADREIDESVIVDDSRSFAKKKVWQRILVVVAGAAMNLLLGFVLLLVYNGALQEKQPDSNQVLFATTTILELPEDSSAYKTGLRPGDTIVEVNGRRILMCDDLMMEMQNDADGKFDMVVRREVKGQIKKTTLNDVPLFEFTKEHGVKYDFILLGEPRTFWNTITYSAKQEVSIATIVARTLIDLVQGDYGINDLSGPVGTVDVIADVVESSVATSNWRIGVGYLVMLMILLTVNLGVFNLLPLPALDGGRLIFLIWEGITRKPVSQKYEAVVHFVGIVLLLVLMLFITYSDVTKLFG